MTIPPRRASFPARLSDSAGAGSVRATPVAQRQPVPPMPSGAGMDSQAVRSGMVERLRAQPGMHPQALDAMSRVPRHLFLEPGLAAQAYLDNALPIGHGQTISKPSVVARSASVMLQALGARPAKVLEIGTGCGYQAAVLACVADEVYSIERIRALHELARRNLRALRLPNLRLLFGDGMAGAPVVAPFDAVISAAAGEHAPAAWLEQLRPGGVLLAPLGQPQRLTVMRKLGAGRFESRVVEQAHFVPLKSGTL